MRSVLILFPFAMLLPFVQAQDEGSGPARKISIGFADTLLFNDSLRYAAYGYEGPAPLFVQVWFPMDATTAAPLTHRELRQRQLKGPLRKVYDELLLRTDSSFIEYDLRYPLDGDDPIDYAPLTERQLLDTLLSGPTLSHRAALPARTNAPVILYHHGSQGSSDENEGMAEYFASRGYLFVSTNFHWPLEGAVFGTPLVWKPDRKSIHRMIDFARDLTTSDSVFYIGHSWGAQEGWCTLHEPGLAQAFISLETTIEWRTDTAEIEEKWPDVLEAVRHHRYPLPILLAADTEGEPPFAFFRGAGEGPMAELDPREPFSHESYTSACFMRLALRSTMPDAEDLSRQSHVHIALLNAIDTFFRYVRHQALFPVDRSQGDFHFRVMATD